jgi:tetratricopeptide (TPR) repeat protein
MEFGVNEITGAIEMLEKMNTAGQLLDRTELIQAYKMRGLLFMQTDHPSEAMDDFTKAMEIIDEMQRNGEQVDDNVKAEVFAVRGMMLFMSGNLDIGLQDMDVSIKIWDALKKQGIPIDEDMLNELIQIKAGLTVFSGEDTSEAHDFMQQNLSADEELKKSGQTYDKSGLAHKYYDVALINMQNDDKHEAIANFTKCIEEYLGIGANIDTEDMKILSSAYMCRGGMLYRIDEDEKALADYNRAVAIEEQFQSQGVEYDSFDKLDVVRLYNERAGVLAYLDEPQKAIDDYIKSLRLNKTVFEDFPDAQEDYYTCLKELLECLSKVSTSQMRLNEILQEFLFPMVRIPKTEEAEETQNEILESLR